MIQAALFVIAICYWYVPQPAQAQDNANPPPVERPIIDDAQKVVEKVEESPKEFKAYIREKLEEAERDFLGQDVELRVQWQWGTYTLFDMGYDHYFKGSYVENLARIPGNPSAKDSDDFYFQTELRFETLQGSTCYF